MININHYMLDDITADKVCETMRDDCTFFETTLWLEAWKAEQENSGYNVEYTRTDTGEHYRARSEGGTIVAVFTITPTKGK